MIANELKDRIAAAFGHVPTTEQQAAIETFCSFMLSRDERAVMLLRGAAGTGKTTLAAAFVQALVGLKQKLVLMSPTGRAAKVFSLYAHHPAYTIHRRIYHQRSAADLSAFNLNANLHADTLFIVDEASMISSSAGAEHSMFGSGQLLDDLIAYVYEGRNCRLMLIGDAAQLPPVGETESRAMLPDVLRGYGLNPFACNLSEVLRQSSESGILLNATMIRRLLADAVVDTPLPVIRLNGFADVTVVPGDELIEQMATSYSRVGTDETIVVTRSNKRANIYNQGIRRTVLDREEEQLCRGDLLMVVKNRYLDGFANGFLANGDRCVVQRVRNVHEMYGFHFAEATLLFPDYDDFEFSTMVMLDTLTSESPSLTRDEHEQLYARVMEDYADIPLKTDRLKMLRQDKYYNALQIKYAYAVTCHKAQGGQWAHVYIDQGYMTDDMLSPDYLHWLYTAFTRATERVFLVNWPERQTANGE